jgi:hypothetical protein
MTRRSWVVVSMLLGMVLGVSAGRMAWGQAATAGALTGTVSDPTGAVVAGATLIISQPSTGFSRTATANAEGSYAFANLMPGQYLLKASAKGFADAVYNDVTVVTGRTLDLNVQMKVGNSTQTVEVSGQGETLETTTNTLATTINPDAVQDLPLNGRDALPFAQLVAGAQSGGDQRFETFDAMPNASLNITVDGMNDNFQRYRTSTTGFFDAAPLRIGAIDEVTVSTNDLTADSGAEGAVTLRFEVKKGTNQYHGNAFWETQNSAFDANTYLNNAQGIAKPKFHISDFGGSLGGPIWKDRIFFFGNYEQEYVPGNLTGYAPILTPQAQTGEISYTVTNPTTGVQTTSTANVLQVAAANGFPSTVNPIVASEFQLINQAAAKATVETTSLPYQNELVWTYPYNTNQIFPTVRFDYQIAHNIEWHAVYDLYWRTYPGEQVYPGDPNTNSSFQSSYSTLSTGLEWSITPSLVNQLSAGVLNTQEEFNIGHSFDPFTAENNLIIAAPSFVNSIFGYSSNGGNALTPWIPNYMLPEPRNNPVRDLSDLLTWSHGKHTLTFGGDFRTSTDFDTGVDNPPAYNLGLSTYDPALNMFNDANYPGMNFQEGNNEDPQNAEDLYATLTGRVSSVSGYNYVNAATHQYEVLGVFKQPEAQKVGGFYFQDAWRITPHLALNYGFRWQFSGAIHNTNDTYTNPTFASLLGPSGALFQPGTLNGVANPQISLRPTPYGPDLEEPSPNVGFAWNPSLGTDSFLGKLAGGSNLVIRGGAAITHYDEGWTTFEQATEYTDPGDTQAVSLNPNPPAATQPSGYFSAGSLSLGQATPALSATPTSFSFPVPESGFTFNYQPFATVDPNLRSPYIENWYIGLQRQVPGNTVIEVNYVGNHSIHMWMNYDLNEINIFGNGFLGEFQTAQSNLASNEQATDCEAPNSTVPCNFEGATGSLPLMEQAFGVGGSAFTNPTNTTFVGTGQAGALANVILSNSAYFCSLVGNGGGVFTPCINNGYTSSTSYPINIFQANPYASGEPIILLSDPGSESYNGLQAQVKHAAGHGLMLMANYAWSHAFTNRYIGDYYTADEAIDNFTTLRNRKLSRAPSPYDQRNTFRTYAVYNLPFRVGSRFAKEGVEGWTISPIFQWQTGRNFKLLGGTNTYNDYDFLYGSPAYDPPDVSDSGVVLDGVTTKQLQRAVGYYKGPNTSTPMLMMNPNVFNGTSSPVSGTVGAEATPGVLGQFIYLHGPQLVSTDFAVTKVFPLFERVTLNMQAEMLNVFNHPEWAIIDGYSGNTNNPAQYVTVSNSPAATGTQTNPEGLNSNGARDIQFRAQIVF